MSKSNRYYWNNFYKGLKSNFFWPWSDLISLTNRFFIKKNKRPKVLEIGVGNGLENNTLFLLFSRFHEHIFHSLLLVALKVTRDDFERALSEVKPKIKQSNRQRSQPSEH